MIAVDKTSVTKTGNGLPTVPHINLEVQAVEQTLNGMEVDVKTRNFVNGNTVNETASVASALGQGSPKVSFYIRNIACLILKCDNGSR